jgi:ubiquinone/menaquinone biosynthesis C-methylase UbiE
MTENTQKTGLLTAAATWGVAGSTYERFSEHFADALAHCVQRLAPSEGEAVLDVATGTGWTARLAAARGARVSGIDYGEELILAARELAQRQGLDIVFDVGDAHALPYPDNNFDAVVSTFGVIFAGNPEQAARELARVCRPGGRLGLAVWSKDGAIATLARKVLAKFSPPLPQPRPPSPYAWGTEARMTELLGSAFELQFEHSITMLREPDGDAVWRLWLDTHGPTVTRVNKLDPESRAAFKKAFVDFHEQYRTALGISMPREYIVAVGVRK